MLSSRHWRHALFALWVVVLVWPAWAQQQGGGDPPEEPALPPGLGEPEETVEETPAQQHRLPAGFHGFIETRAGVWTHDDPLQPKDLSLAEARLQLGYARAWKLVALDAKGDLILDAVTEEADTDLRLLELSFRPARWMDLQVGRQIVTWGTGDLLFVNDLFPKDWQSFFLGRDEEYLKAPSNSLRTGWFAGRVNLDLVYTPEFEPDRYIRGERVGFDIPGMPLAAEVPDGDEIAGRIYGNVGPYEIAGYGYQGFWKSPAGFDPVTMHVTFPALSVWGASARGPLGPGIANLEFGYYDSRDDPQGDDPFVNNSEFRILAGYELELGRELTGGFQYYLEHMLDYDRYLDSLPGGPIRDENRHVLTARITKLLRGQTVIPSIFVYYSPSDHDDYLRPAVAWKRTDHQIIEFGANLFFGRDDTTFFGQFENSSNVYGSFRFQW